MFPLKKVLKILAILFAALALYIGAFIAFGTLNDYHPTGMQPIKADQNAAKKSIIDSTITLATWNIGYAGLGAESDFFYDKGQLLIALNSKVRPDYPTTQRYMKGILQTLQAVPAEFWLLQEVDLHSKRSHFIHQYDSIRVANEGFESSFALNYNLKLLPLPLLEPWRFYGKVQSGLATLAKFTSISTERHQLPGAFPWPDKVFQLDRCASIHRYECPNNKQLVLVNLHLSAYDKQAAVKAKELEYLRQFFLEEWEKGHYVIAGGDWNLCPPYFRFDSFMPGMGADYVQFNIEPDWLPEDWKWVYDPTIPTNRNTDAPFKKGTTFTTLIDFFLISPNVKALKVKGINQDFQFSDHQPVWMEVGLEN